MHEGFSCTACHGEGTFEPLFEPEDADDCVACHQSDYDGRHSGSGYPTDCLSCHTPTLWSDGEFNHAGISGGFELTGVHMEAACTSCHDAVTFAPLFDPVDTNDCVACHQSDYDGRHSGSGYPTDCLSCHTPTLWSDGEFNHAGISGGFELTGVHMEAACTSCHDAATFAPLFDPVDTSDCVACHQSDYDGHHLGSGYPTDCAGCHTPTLWSDGVFNHEVASGGYQLLGVHTSAPCTSCHDAATFTPLFDPVDETDCVACHQADYDGEHDGSGYPTTCNLCHTQTTWGDAAFNHDTDYFPIFTGEHAPRWSDCSTCHTNPTDFSDFTCFTCHVHGQTQMDNKHEGRPGYSYVPSACVSCHPDGTAD